MVHKNDRTKADQVAKIAQIPPAPPDWKASWKRNKHWRGLATIKRAPPRVNTDHLLANVTKDEYSKRPAVVFTGQFTESRNTLIDEARNNGWKTLASINREVSVLVASAENTSRNKVIAAEKYNVPIISIEDWKANWLYEV